MAMNDLIGAAVAAAERVLGAAWPQVADTATAQIGAMAAIAAQIEAQHAAGTLTEADYRTLQVIQKNALQGVLQAYAGIGILVAQQAADAAWAVFATALRGAILFA